MTTPLLDMRVEAKCYGERTVLAHTEVQIAPGEVVSLVGPSGCGKSTLLKIAAGLDAGYRGEVRMDGAPQRAPSPRIGVIFQEPRLLPWLTIADNVGFAAGPQGGRDPRVATLLEEVGLAPHAQALPKSLSGGMAQRAALARGLFGQPDLLLLDEPFSAVDAITRMRLQTLLLTLVHRHHSAALLITHDLDEALYLSDRVLLMAAGPGRIVEQHRIGADHPRRRGDPALASLKERMIEHLESAQLA